VEQYFALISLIVSGIALLLGGGLLSRYIVHSNRQAVLNHDAERNKADIAKNTADLVLVHSQIALMTYQVSQISTKLEKLDLLEVVHTNVENLKEMAQNMMPRLEGEAKIRAVDQRVDGIAAVVFHKP
jgi:hypothetical protein